MAEFIVYHETTEAIKEALDMVKSWNPGWEPPYGMTDYDDAEISALEAAFPGIHIYICEFHREQAWTRWVRKGENGLKAIEQQQLLSCLRNIAQSKNECDLKRCKDQLEASDFWKNKANLREYVTTQWLKCERRWVKCFRNPLVDRCVNTNNGVEAINKILKHNYLKFYCDRSATGLITMLINTFLPDRYKAYVKINHKMTNQYSKYTEHTPGYLRDRPMKFIKHMEAGNSKGRAIPQSDIAFISPSKYTVKSQLDSKQAYEVDLKIPKCGCHDFFRTNWPCKHMHAIFICYPESGWESLRDDYKNSPFITVDREILKLRSLKQPIAFKPRQSTHVPEPAESLPSDADVVEEPSDTSSMPDHTKDVRQHQEQLRILLKKAVDRSFMCNDLDRLKSGIDYTLKMISSLEKGCNAADNMLLVSDEIPKHLQGKLMRKRKQDKQPVGISNKFGKLPPYKKPGNTKHWKARGRFGKRADIYRTNYKCKLNITGVSTAKKVLRKYVSKGRQSKPRPKQITIKRSINPVSTQLKPPTQVAPEPTPSANKKLKLSSCGILSSINRPTNLHNLPFDPHATLFSYGAINITWYQLMSLENPSALSPSDKCILRQISSSFKPGWLYDSIVDSYLGLQSLLHNSLFCESTTFLSMRAPDASPTSLWKDLDVAKYNTVIAPYNINSNHWILFIANLQEQVLHVIDPMKQISSGTQVAENIMTFIIACKTGIQCTVNHSKAHILQTDSVNCGIYICHYAECYLQGKPLTEPFSIVRLRRKIKEVLAGSCVDDIRTRGMNLHTCKVCNQGGKLEVTCIRCNQGYHDLCVTKSTTGNYFCQKSS